MSERIEVRWVLPSGTIVTASAPAEREDGIRMDVQLASYREPDHVRTVTVPDGKCRRCGGTGRKWFGDYGIEVACDCVEAADHG